MSCNRLSTNNDPTRRSHIETAQRAADSDQMKIAVNRACTTATIAKINDTNINIVHKFYPPPQQQQQQQQNMMMMVMMGVMTGNGRNGGGTGDSENEY